MCIETHRNHHRHHTTQKNDANDASNQKINDGNSIIKRHRKRRRGRKKHAATNCGTKEPKRPTEAQIEWQPQGKVCKYSSFIIYVYRMRYAL